jgi:hypothetical protein
LVIARRLDVDLERLMRTHAVVDAEETLDVIYGLRAVSDVPFGNPTAVRGRVETVERNPAEQIALSHTLLPPGSSPGTAVAGRVRDTVRDTKLSGTELT